MKNVFCSIDIGSSLCHVIIARPSMDLQDHSEEHDTSLAPGSKASLSYTTKRTMHETVEILGVGSIPSQGVRAGELIKMDALAQCIREAVHEAEIMAGLELREATVNISGKHLTSKNSEGVVAISNKSGIIARSDVLRSIESARSIHLPPDQEIIHVLSKEFSVDKQEGIHDPVGMSGLRLEAHVHLVSANASALSNLSKALGDSGIGLLGGVMNSLASAEAVLLPDERDLGTAVLDIGGGLTDVAVYAGGALVYSFVIPYGGMHITKDIATVLGLSLESAEFLKKNYGVAQSDLVDPTERIELPSLAGRPSRQDLRKRLAEIIEARLSEILEMVDIELLHSGFKNFLTGVILCGGSSLLDSSEKLAESVLSLNTEVRAPVKVKGFLDRVASVEFCTGVGLLNYVNRMSALKQKEQSYAHGKSAIFSRLKGWFIENI